MKIFTLCLMLFISLASQQAKGKNVDWKIYTGKTGPSGWKVHVLQADPKKGDMWYATYKGDSMKAENWKSVLIPTPGSGTRHKMDNVYTGDLDGDGDIDILTTDENSSWGILWFENPVK